MTANVSLVPSDFGFGKTNKTNYGKTKKERSNFRNNLKVLSTPLGKDEIIVVDKKNPERLATQKLTKISRLAYRFKKKESEKEVRQVIKGVIKKLDFTIDQELEEISKKIKSQDEKLEEAYAALHKTPSNTNEKKAERLSDRLEKLYEKKNRLEEKRAKIQTSLSTLLYKRMSSLSESIYNRGKIRQSAIDILRPELQEDKETKKAIAQTIEKAKDDAALDKRQNELKTLKSEARQLRREYKRISKKRIKARAAKKAEIEAKKAKIAKKTQKINEHRAFIAKKERKLALQKADRRINKVKFAQDLGIRMQPISVGASGSYFAKDYKGKIKGVFKPAEEESVTGQSQKMTEKIKRFIIKLLPISDPAAPFHSKEGYLAEAMTTILAKHLRFNTVPASRVVKLSTDNLKDAKGSFQVFVKNTKSAKEAVMKLSNDEIAKVLSPEEIEELFVIDFLTFNRDRHEENWLVSKDPDPVTGKRSIYLIDHGLSFPKQHPSKNDVLLGFSFYGRNQFKYADRLPLKRAFSPEMKERLLDRLENVREKLLEKLRNADPDVTHFDEEDDNEFSQEKMLEQRIDVLLYCIENNWTIRDIADIKTQEDIDRTLGLGSV